MMPSDTSSIVSLSFDATVQTSKPNSRIELSKSNAIRNSSSTINARRDEKLGSSAEFDNACTGI
jgi:hypothetical protein